MSLGGLAVVGQEVRVQAVEVALLLVGDTGAVLVRVLDLLALGVLLVGEQLADLDARGLGLAGRVLLLLLGLSLLLLLGSAGASLAVGRSAILVGFVVGVVASMVFVLALGGGLSGVAGRLSGFVDWPVASESCSYRKAFLDVPFSSLRASVGTCAAIVAGFVDNKGRLSRRRNISWWRRKYCPCSTL